MFSLTQTFTWTGRVQASPIASVCPQGDPAEISTKSDIGDNHQWYKAHIQT